MTVKKTDPKPAKDNKQLENKIATLKAEIKCIVMTDEDRAAKREQLKELEKELKGDS